MVDPPLVPESAQLVIAVDLPEGWSLTEVTFGTVIERLTARGFRPNVIVAQEQTTVSLVEASSAMLAAAIAAHAGTRILDVRREAHAVGSGARLLYGYPLGDDWIVVDQRVITTGTSALHVTGSVSVQDWIEVEPLLAQVAASVRLLDEHKGASA